MISLRSTIFRTKNLATAWCSLLFAITGARSLLVLRAEDHLKVQTQTQLTTFFTKSTFASTLYLHTWQIDFFGQRYCMAFFITFWTYLMQHFNTINILHYMLLLGAELSLWSYKTNAELDGLLKTLFFWLKIRKLLNFTK